MNISDSKGGGVRENLKVSGYDKEEEYFYKLNQDLIEKRRKELDSKRTEAKKPDSSFWMVCPKCGSSMEEKNLTGILIDQCTGCQGIYFDRGELDLMLQTRENQTLLDKIKNRLF